ncbi:MAG: hypothetical protein EOO40_05125 [Deltaproteobacteria bacterium]|nr:MAG: hypothetical protein EOO40_05125 [Deltaproteobacteria bacterium]
MTGRDGEMFHKWCDIVGRPTDHLPALPGEAPGENDDICPECEGAFVIDRCQSFQVCPDCGFARYFMEGGLSNLTYDQEMSMESTSNSPYEKINHLNEILASVQGKETTAVPDAVVNAVRLEFKKDGVKLARLVTPAAVLAYLKKLGKTDWVSDQSVEEPGHELVEEGVRADGHDGEQPYPEHRHEDARLAGAGPQEVGVLELLLEHGVRCPVVRPRHVQAPRNQNDCEHHAHVQKVEKHAPDVGLGVNQYLWHSHCCYAPRIYFSVRPRHGHGDVEGTGIAVLECIEQHVKEAEQVGQHGPGQLGHEGQALL